MPTREQPQSNKQHAVPQNIMDVEFKLIGELTMRQFVYLLIFLGLAYFFFTLNISIVFRIPLTLGAGLLGLGLAFVPIEDRGLDEWIINFFNAVYAENQMVWRKTPTPPTPFVYQNLSMVKQELITLAPTASRRKLERFLEVQGEEKEEDPFEQLEQQYIQKVQDVYSQYEPQPEAAVTTVEDPQPAQAEPETIGEEPEDLTPPQKPEKPQPEQPKQPEKEKPEKQEPSKEIKTKPKPAPQIKKQPKRKQPSQIQISGEAPLDTITPDRHTGRKFSSMLPDEGSLVLPIRGETVIEPTSEEKQEEVSINQKAEQLRKFISQIESQESTQKQQQVSSEGSELIQKLKEEKEQLMAKIKKLEEEIAEIEDPQEKRRRESHVKTLMDKTAETATNIDKLEEQISSLQTTTKPKEKVEGIPKHLQPEEPNTVAGIVKNSQGKRLPNILILIKNKEDEPVRAIKTNELGEFSISNPLQDGQYKIEVDVNNSSGFNFDIIELETEGEIIPAMEIIGK